MLSRLSPHPNSNLFSKLRVYDGENLKETEPNAKSMQEYRDSAGVDEGMDGISTRFAFKVLAATFNYDTEEVGGRPGASDVRAGTGDPARAVRRGDREAVYRVHQGRRSRRAMPNSSATRSRRPIWSPINDYGQNLFDRYVDYADAWIEDLDFKDPDTGQMMDRELLNQELTKIEKPAGIANPKDFRNEVVKFALRARAQRDGKNPSWTCYEKIREVIERRMFSQVEDLLPIISFGSKKEVETERSTPSSSSA